MTTTRATSEPDLQRPSRSRGAVRSGCAALAFIAATPLAVVTGAGVAVILLLPALALVCYLLAIELETRETLHAAQQTPAWIRRETARGLRALEVWANSGSAL